MDVPERMLMAQALELQVVFSQLMAKASKVNNLKQLQPILQLALKAQSNCRTTLETLNDFKNPRQFAFVRQTNVANGPQQVNNGAEPKAKPTRAHGKTQKAFQTNELLEVKNGGSQLDSRATKTAGRGGATLETVGVIDRPAQSEGQAKKLPKRRAARAAVEAVA